jgi:hypothetical protein
MTELHKALSRYRALQTRADTAREAAYDAIRQAAADGMTTRRIAGEIGFSHQRIAQILKLSSAMDKPVQATPPPKKPQRIGRAGSSQGVTKAPIASKSDRTPRCTWIEGCDEPATHNLVRDQGGWHAVAEPREDCDGEPLLLRHPIFCAVHAEREAAAKHCKHAGCKRLATHYLSIPLGSGQWVARPTSRSYRAASYCKQHAEQEAAS